MRGSRRTTTSPVPLRCSIRLLWRLERDSRIQTPSSAQLARSLVCSCGPLLSGLRASLPDCLGVCQACWKRAVWPTRMQLPWEWRYYPGNDAKLIRCVLGMTLNSSVVVQGMTVKLWPCLRFRACGWAVSGGKPSAGKGVVGLLSWHGSHFWVCITFCKVRHGDSVIKPDYYYYYFYIYIFFYWFTLSILNSWRY